MSNEKQLLAEIAYRYYIDDLTQHELSVEFGIGRSSISRMLNKAKEDGIVEFKIQGIDTNIMKLKKEIMKKYNLKTIDIVDNSLESTTKSDNLAQGASSVISRLLTDHTNIGVSWGETISETVKYMEGRKLNDVHFIPLVGGPSSSNTSYHINAIVYDLANKFKSHSIFINASAIQENKLTAENILTSQYFAELIQYWKNIDVAIVGIGGILSTKNSQWRDLLSEDDYEFLKLFDAAGDLCCRFVDKHGNLIVGDLNDRTIGIDAEIFNNIPKRIGIAQGKHKISAIKGLLNKNILNHLITDTETAKLL